MNGPLLVLGIVAVVLLLDLWLAARVGRYLRRADRAGRTVRASFLGGRR